MKRLMLAAILIASAIVSFAQVKDTVDHKAQGYRPPTKDTVYVALREKMDTLQNLIIVYVDNSPVVKKAEGYQTYVYYIDQQNRRVNEPALTGTFVNGKALRKELNELVVAVYQKYVKPVQAKPIITEPKK